MGTEVTFSMLERMAAANGMTVEAYAEKNGYDIAAMKLQEAKLGGEVAAPGDELVFKGKQFNITINGVQGTVTCKGNELEEGTIVVSDNVLAMFPGVKGFTVKDGELYAQHKDGNSYPVATLEKTTDIPPMPKPSSTLPPAVKHLADIFGVEKLAPFVNMTAAQLHVKEQIAKATDALEKAEEQDDPISKSQAQWIKSQLSELYKTQKLLAEIREEKDPATQTKKAIEYITSSKLDFDEKGQFVQQAASGKAVQKAITLGVAAVIATMLLASCTEETDISGKQSQATTINMPPDDKSEIIKLLREQLDYLKSIDTHVSNIDNNLVAQYRSLNAKIDTLINKTSSIDDLYQYLQLALSELTALVNDVKINQESSALDNKTQLNTIINALSTIIKYAQIDQTQKNELIKLLNQIKQDTGDIKNYVSAAIKKLEELIGLNKQQCDKLEQITNQNEELRAVLEAIYGKLDKMDADLKGYFEGIVKAILANGAKLDALAQLLAIINNNVVEGSKQQQEAAKKILAALEALNFNVVGGMDAILKAVLDGNAKLDEILAVLNNIQGLVKHYGENGEALGNAILEAIGRVNITLASGFNGIAALIDRVAKNQELTQGQIAKLTTMFDKFSENTTVTLEKILEQMGNDSAKLDQLIALLNQMDKNNAERTNAILAAIAALGVSMTAGFTAIQKAINEGNKGIAGLLDKVLANQATMIKNNKEGFKAVIDAIQGISINVDLTAIKKLLEEIKKGVNDNGGLLTQIRDDNNVIRMTLAAFKTEVGTKIDGMNAWLEKIYDKIPENGTGGCNVDFDKLMKKLDEILEAIKNIPGTDKITIDITGKVTCQCNCNCGGNSGTPHEGIIGNLEDLLG